MNELATETPVLPTVESEKLSRSGFSRSTRALARRIGLDLAHLVAIFLTSVLAFAVWIGTLTATVSVLMLVAGIFVWFASTYVYRWATHIDRRLTGRIREKPIAAVYRRPASSRFLDRLRCVTTDPQTWKDLGWLMLNSVVGFAVSLIGLLATVAALSYILMPLWWWAISDPGDQYGTLNLGIYTVHNVGIAFLSTAIGLVLMPLALLLNRGLVAGHSALAARILGPSEGR